VKQHACWSHLNNTTTSYIYGVPLRAIDWHKSHWDTVTLLTPTQPSSQHNKTTNMLDINDFIKERGGNPEKIKESQRRRHAPEEIVDEIIEMFEDHRKTQYNAATEMGAKINKVQKEMGLNKKNKGDPAEFEKLRAEKEALAKEKLELEELAKSKYADLMKKAKSVGNYVHESVPLSDNEDNNKVERMWAPEGVEVSKKDCLSHHEVLARLDGYDPERGVKIVGHRGYCLTGYGLFLNLALVNYGLEFLFNKGYKPNQPPFFMLREAMAKTAQLEEFDEALYKVTEKENDPATDKYLIATSEQPISAMHESEWLNDKDLPIKYAGYSTNFRKEAGSHGKDAWGLFRVHQFEKIEQFIFCKPEDSWTHFDQMIDTSEEFYKTLGLPHRVVGIVSGALNNAAAKKYDLEAWFPFQGEYKELVSCSNCTDYQTRELEIRYVTNLHDTFQIKTSKLTHSPQIRPKEADRRLIPKDLHPRPQLHTLRHRACALLRARELPD
jgi:seryl-tRNA synthetase